MGERPGRWAAAAAVLMALPACGSAPDKVQMRGVVWDGPEAAESVAGASLEVTDASGARFAQATSNADGSFIVEVPAGSGYVLTVSATGYVPTGWAGESGLEDFSAGSYAPWIPTVSWMDQVRGEWAGCPGADGTGTAVLGELRLGYPYIIDGVPGEGAVATLLDSDGGSSDGCYRDANGAPAPDAESAGPDGLYAIFGAPAGVAWTTGRYEDAAGELWETAYLAPLPEGGLVVLFPTLVLVDTP